MDEYGSQIEQAKQQAAQAGFGGSAIIDVHPSEGFLRIKVSMNPPDRLAEFMDNYANGLAATLSMMNVEAKVHTTGT